MTDLITAEEAQKLLDEVAQNPPRVCIAWCGKAKDDCACYKAGVAVGALNDAAPDLARTVIALHAELAQAHADTKAAVAVAIEKAVKEAETCRDVAVHDDDHAVGWRNASQAIAGGIRALAPEDAIAEVAGLRAERDALFRRATLAEEWRDHDKARVTELAAELAAAHDKYQRDVFGLNNEGDPIGGDPPSGLKHRAEKAEAALAQPSTGDGE